MDYEVPEFPGVRRNDDDLRALDGDYFTPELLELLLRGDDGGGGGAGSYVVHENPWMMNLPPPLPPPCPVPTYRSAGNPSGEAIASEADMASWLCQIMEQEASDEREVRDAATAETTNSEGGHTVPSCSGGAPTGGVEAGGAAECRRGRSSSGRRRACSGKAAEQRRRDKINDKMRTLQKLIPRCSKTDKASTLEEVIKYVKSLQHQVQVMSASGYHATPTTTPILPLGVMPPATMLPRYPFFPTVYACPHHGTPLPLSAPYTRRQQAEPAAGSSGGWQQPAAAPRRRLVPNNLQTVPSYM